MCWGRKGGEVVGEKVCLYIPRLEPLKEANHVWMRQSLEDFHFSIDHIEMAFDIAFGNDLDGYWLLIYNSYCPSDIAKRAGA